MTDPQLQREFDRIKEKVEKFTGERGDDAKSLSALRRGELVALASQTLKSKQLTSTPTIADYNALQADIATIFKSFSLMSNRAGNADIPKV